MNAVSIRRIKDGRDWDHLFPRAKGDRELIRKRGKLKDTLGLLPKIIRQYSWQVRQLAPKLKGSTLENTCRRIWEFCYGHYQYAPDAEGYEEIRTPARAWADRKAGIDCDCYTVTISAILLELGIAHQLKVTKYPDPKRLNPDPPYSHIYVVVANGKGKHYTIDPVTDSFDLEVPYLKSIEIPMELHVLNGPTSQESPPSQMGMDFQDLYGGGYVQDGLGSTPVHPLILRKQTKGMENAKAAGKIPQNYTLQQYLAWARKDFEQRTGKTPEEYRQDFKNQMDQSRQESQAREQAELDKVRAELRKRGVAYSPNAGRGELLALLRQNPPPKLAGKVISTINKVNPATALVRTGILVAMKTNMFRIAERLRWGFYPNYAAAAKAGFRVSAKAKGSPESIFVHYQNALARLRKIQQTAGGNPEKFKDAILTGKGNKSGQVSLRGPVNSFDDLQTTRIQDILGYDIYASEVLPVTGVSGLSGLGEPITASAAVAAATAVLGTIAVLLKQKDGGLPGEASTGLNPVNSQTPDLMPDSSNIPGYETSEEFPPEAGRTPQPPPDEKRSIGQWAKDNPLLVGAIGVAVVGGGYLAYKALQPKADTALSGPSGDAKSDGTGSRRLYWNIPPEPASLKKPITPSTKAKARSKPASKPPAGRKTSEKSKPKDNKVQPLLF